MWLIDRTWKPREGWSRPALTVEDNQHHHDEAGKPRRHHGGTNTKSLTRVHDPVPEPPPADRITDFAAAMAQGRRPVPFRTRKLRPGTAMVLHPTGCGRVARRRTTRQGPPDEANNPRGPTHTQTQQPTGMRSTHLIRFTGATVSEDGSRWSRTVLNVMAATHKPKRT